MNSRILKLGLASLTCCTLALACGGDTPGLDNDNNKVADDLGKTIDTDGNGADGIDINKDGSIDGPGLDSDGDGVLDALLLDTDCDGIFDSFDITGDGAADFTTTRVATPTDVPGCDSNPIAAGGSSSGGSGSTGGTSTAGPSQLGSAIYQGAGTTTDRYAEFDLYRNGVGYKFIANGWGDKWGSHQISWNGTSFTVDSLTGSVGDNYSPAAYPTVFCGFYSQKQSIASCGLPAAISALSSIRTGWRWKANGNTGQYNAAWDIWLGNGNSLSAYLMVWLRDPPGQQPAGSAYTAGATVAGLPGDWTIWTGSVMGHPIVNYVRSEGQDLGELEFDVMAVYRDALQRNFSLPGTHVMAVAVGYEVWNGPITNLVTEDFYVDVK